MSLGPILTHTTLLAALALLARVAGVALRVRATPSLRLVGWLMCALATWGAAGAAGAFSPVWPALLVGVAGGLGMWRRPFPWAFAAGDAAVVTIVLITSTPRLPWEVTAAFLLALLVAWGGIEAAIRIAGRWLWKESASEPSGSARLARLAVAGIATTAAVFLFAAADTGDSGRRLLPVPSMLPHLAVSSQCEGERVELPGGAVGWLEGPGAWGWEEDGEAEAGESGIAALLLHGHDDRASRQPAACVLRRALVHAGFLTLAVDHPGYGSSPAPEPEAPVEAWDFVPAHAEAYDWLASRPGVRHVIVVGHSMGAQNAIRLARARPDIPLLFLLAGSIVTNWEAAGEGAENWYERFHRVRALSDRLPRSQWRKIERLFYDGNRAIRDLPRDHGLVVFGEMGHEWKNVVAGRGPFFDRIPGRKELWQLRHSSHYLNAFQVAGVTIGDARVARRLASDMRSRAAEVLSD